jgi:NAD-dependent dihydropyrimidine dehydrogenase PreA subunit
MSVFVRSDLIGDLGYNIAHVEFPEKCTGCKACILYCPDFALTVEKETDNG